MTMAMGTNSFAVVRKGEAMSWRIALIALTLIVPSGVSAAIASCGNSPRPSKPAAFSADTSGPPNSTVTFSGGRMPRLWSGALGRGALRARDGQVLRALRPHQPEDDGDRQQIDNELRAARPIRVADQRMH
jgi:hypothetical protein